VARKHDISRLLAKGLSGEEAGRLAVQHLLEVERGGPGFLTDKDIEVLKKGVSGGAAAAAGYTRMLDLYQVVRELLCEAQIASLEAVSFLRETERELERYAISSQVAHLVANLPLLVSEEAYEEMRERQRLRLEARLYSLAEVIEERATERLGGWEKAEEASETRWDAAYQAAEKEIEKLIETDTLRPTRLAHKASLLTMERARESKRLHDDKLLQEDLAALEQEARESHAGTVADAPSGRSEGSETEVARHKKAYRERLKASLAQGDLTEGYDISDWIGEAAPKDEERLLHHYVSGEQLVGAKLPEWRRWIEEFKPWLDGDEGEGGVAVVVDKGLGKLDARGRYQSHSLARLGDVLDVKAVEHGLATQHGRSVAELLTSMYATARACSCVLLAHLQVIAEASEVARIAFLGGPGDGAPDESETTSAREVEEHLLAHLRLAAESYNLLAVQVGRWRGEILGPRLPRFEFADLRSDENTLAVSRERIALGNGRGGLGASWWREAFDG
jgi:hypothetical protein